jgi:hypothetical protein
MIFKWRKSTMKSDPVFGLAELRAAIEHVVERGRNAGLRHYQLAEVLEQAAQPPRRPQAETASPCPPGGAGRVGSVTHATNGRLGPPTLPA